MTELPVEDAYRIVKAAQTVEGRMAMSSADFQRINEANAVVAAWAVGRLPAPGRKGPRPTRMQRATLKWFSEQPHGQGRAENIPRDVAWYRSATCERMVARGWLREFPGVADAFILTDAGRAALEGGA